MTNQTKPDYEKLYHVMNARRGVEQQILTELCSHLYESYVNSLRWEKQYRLCYPGRERLLYNDILVRVSGLMDAVIETDRKLDDCATLQGEPAISVIPGGKERYGTQTADPL